MLENYCPVFPLRDTKERVRLEILALTLKFLDVLFLDVSVKFQFPKI